jgi:hypothetical protein
MTTRSADWTDLGFWTVGLCLTSWYVRVDLDYVVKAHLIPTSMQVARPTLPLVCLWWWSQRVATLLDERVPAAMIFAIALPLAIWLVLWI